MHTTFDNRLPVERSSGVNTAEIAGFVIAALREVAPETDVATLDPAKSFHDQLDIDSIDFLNLMLTLEENLNIRIAEADYPMLSTLDGCIAYLSNKMMATAGASTSNS